MSWYSDAEWISFMLRMLSDKRLQSRVQHSLQGLLRPSALTKLPFTPAMHPIFLNPDPTAPSVFSAPPRNLLFMAPINLILWKPPFHVLKMCVWIGGEYRWAWRKWSF